ncbi:MAG: FAD-dependent oxidoreductase [Candidatus Alcyoniella australis]|nr:FAD-dependent oxidoreductase [Candidatus Alcyoniella australis]
MSRISLFKLLPLLCVALLLTLCIACESGDDDDDDQAPPDAVSSASPDVVSAQLGGMHSGWGNADCAGCHGQMHYDGFLDGECVTCHGSNGAPLRPAGHALDQCSSCHAGSHAALNFVDERHCTACHKFDPQIQCPAEQDVDVVVIGAGGGGVAAAAALALAGMDVVLIEKHYKVGGYMTTFQRDGYTFEASLHAMSGLGEGGSTRAMFEDLDIMHRINPILCDPTYRAVFPGVDVLVPGDIWEYRKLLIESYPDEEDGIVELFEDMRRCSRALQELMALGDGVTIEEIFKLVNDLPYAINLLRYMDMPLAEMVGQYINDPELVGLFEQLVTYIGLGPSELQALYFVTMWGGYHLEGFYYFEGGSATITEGLAQVFLENGGSLRLNTTATKIVIQDGRAVQVQTADDACYNTRYVVSNANAWSTLLGMVGEEYLPADYVQKLKGMTLGVATLQVFMGVDYDYNDLFQGSHELMVNESNDMDVNFQYSSSGDLENTFFIISNYSKVDPGFAPEGKSSISLTTYLPYDIDQRWGFDEGYEEYLEYRENVAQVLIARAEEYLPGLSEHIEVLEIGTPVTNELFSFNPAGTILGWANTVDQGTLRRLQQQTPIENLYLAGAYTFPGGGQSAVLSSGQTAASMILEAEADQ